MKKILLSILTVFSLIINCFATNYPITDNGVPIGYLSLNTPYTQTNYAVVTQTNVLNVIFPVYVTNYTTVPVYATNYVTVYNTNQVYVTNYPPVVVSTNKSPTVVLNSPTNGQVFAGNSATVNATATASDSDGWISKVEFYVEGGLQYTDTTSPYSYSSTFGQGSYPIQAKAYDNSNAVASSVIATILVTNSVIVVPPVTNQPPVTGSVIYVRAGATGNGSDWANALGALPTTPVRGTTYLVASGSYSGRVFSTPDSGSSWITIKKATISNHGDNVGWVDSYANQATFTSGFTFKSSYWSIDGSVGSLSRNPSDYGFTFSQISSAFIVGNTVGPSYSNIKISHVASKATTSDVEKMFYQNGFQVAAINNITISHCLLDGWQGGMMARGQGGAACNNWLFEYNICLNGYSSSANHGEWINPNSAGINAMTIRYNIFSGSSGSSGMTGIIVANNSSFNNGLIYGNVFHNVKVGNGVISGTSAGSMNNTKVYNNSFVGGFAATGNALSGPGSGNVAANNLYYASPTGVNSFSESDRLVATSDPFVDSANLNFNLKSPTRAGLTLPAPLNTDANGKVRGADNNWDIGAFEF